jgi:Ribonuclease G/E
MDKNHTAPARSCGDAEQADEAVTALIEAADDVLRNGHQHDVGGGDVFIGTCDSTERLQRALDAARKDSK